MALGTEVVDLIRLHLLNNPDQVGAVSEVAVVEHQARTTLMRVLIKVINRLVLKLLARLLIPCTL